MRFHVLWRCLPMPWDALAAGAPDRPDGWGGIIDPADCRSHGGGGTNARWRQTLGCNAGLSATAGVDPLDAGASEETVLANFGLSAWLLLNQGFPSGAAPKFEMPLSAGVQQYGELLFKEASGTCGIGPITGVQYYVCARRIFRSSRIVRCVTLSTP